MLNVKVPSLTTSKETMKNTRLKNLQALGKENGMNK
jgi:hypothetical protein